jgi:hypothetical protein
VEHHALDKTLYALHSYAVVPAHFASPGRIPAERCWSKSLFGLAKRHKQPEGYVHKYIDNSMKKW